MSGDHNMNLYGDGTVFRGERSADSEEPTIDWQSTCEMWKAAHEKADRIANDLQDIAHKQAQQLSRWEASYNAVCDERDAIAKDADKAYMLLRWAETEMRYAGWGDRAVDNHGRSDVYEAVVGFLK